LRQDWFQKRFEFCTMNTARMNKLLVFVLLWGFVLRVGVLVGRDTDYWYDEAIVANISKQGIEMLLDTVSSEPHPPGFYFLLKLFPVDNPLVTRLSLLFVSEVLLVGGVIWAVRNVRNWEEFRLGIIVFLTSYGYLWSGMDVKQGVVTVPVWLWWFWIWILSWEQKLNLKQEILWAVLSMVIIWFDYRYSAVLVVLMGLQWWINRDKKYLGRGLTFLGSVLLVVLAVGWKQTINNVTRFGWTVSRESSVFSGFQAFFIGRPFSDWAGDAILVVLVTWFIIGATRLIARRKQKNVARWIWIVVGGLTLLLMYVGMRGFILVRYAVPLYFIGCLVIGMGLQNVWARNKLGKKAVAWSIFIFFVSGAAGVLTYDPGWFSDKLAQTISDVGPGAGFISEHPNFSVVFLIQRTEIEGAAGVNIYDIVGSTRAHNITKRVLGLEGLDLRARKLSLDQVRTRLAESGLKKFVYMADLNTSPFYDSKRQAFFVLGNMCQMKKVETLGGTTFLIIWDECNFEDRSLPDPIPVYEKGSDKDEREKKGQRY
ncbi:MAG: hypothetical protein AAB909_00240, partial [Patescibacteria group bacterium]